MALCRRNATVACRPQHKVHAGLPRGARCGRLFRLRGRPPACHRRGRSPLNQPTSDHADGATLGRWDAKASHRPRRPMMRVEALMRYSHPASSIQHPASSIQHPASSIQHHPAPTHSRASTRIRSASPGSIQVIGVPRFSIPRNQVSCRLANRQMATARSSINWKRFLRPAR